MKSRSIALFALAVALTPLAAGCDGQSGPFFRMFNQRPAVDLTAAPVGTADTAWYAYEIRWTGTDPDGRVVRFEYAIDPPTVPAADTTWIATTTTRERFYFRATEPYWDPVHGWRANGFHTFALRAVDDAGAYSPVVSRAFYSYTIAPIVRIVLPAPNPFFERSLPQNATIEWEGKDEDGVVTKRPVKYRYRLFRHDDPDFGLAMVVPDSLRRLHASHAFAGWDSVGGDTTFVRYPSLVFGESYLFVVIAVDHAGAYSPAFSRETNMLRFSPVPSIGTGPLLTVFNEFFYYEYRTGGVSTDPRAWINLEVPADRPIAFHFFAEPLEGTRIEWYRWRLDGDIADEEGWSPPTDSTTVTLGPFTGGEEHFLYLEAHDSWGLTSLAIVHFKVVALTRENELLVVDDTRLAPDQFHSNGTVRPYGNSSWPAAAELDTFLYAQGGFPWRGPSGSDQYVSKPGVFHGYRFDTLGTRRGFELASAGVPLSLLGRYRHILWLTDITGAVTLYGPESPIDPISTLRWMSTPGHMNTFAAYLASGGEGWLAGGTGLTCATLPVNATGSRNNDPRYGPGHTVFSRDEGELAPGRLVWDAAHWRSEFVASRPVTLPARSTFAIGGWSNPGWKFQGTIVAPNYALLPALMRRRSLALGDSLPPTRTGYAAAYYSTAVNPAVEYLTRANFTIEDVDAGPAVVDEHSVLDTLYQLQGGALATQYTGNVPVTMTYYHGVEAPRFVSTGFDLWTWSRQDIQALADFVLQEIWGMGRTAPVPVRPAALRAAPVPAATGKGDLPARRAGTRR